MLIREKKYMSLEPRIPLYVSGFGPRAMELGGEYGDGLVIAIPPRGVPPAEALAHARVGAARAGHALPDDFHLCALTSIVLLEPGEPADSERVIRAVGPNVMASVYYFYDAVHERGIEPPPFLRRIWRRYCALVAETARAPPFRTHEYHYTDLHPGEAELIDADLVRDTCLVGTAEELIERIQELERGGLRELMWATGTDEKWRFSQQLADRVLARL
jgi:alkanesulfonate monooxygenase SsuD/methylene tetrahydromethanopterin reductase-like flavin-dependent oxidoreductase (luciferase family)